MHKFLRLGKHIVNTSAIKSITIGEKQYYVNLITPNVGGMLWFSFGSINTTNDYIYVCAEKEPESYKTLTNWIQSVTNEDS